MMIKLVSLKI